MNWIMFGIKLYLSTLKNIIIDIKYYVTDKQIFSINISLFHSLRVSLKHTNWNKRINYQIYKKILNTFENLF